MRGFFLFVLFVMSGAINACPTSLILANNITIDSVPVTLCKGAAFNIPYTAVGSFDVDNIFTAQLSDSGGSFANPDTIGSLSSQVSGTITGTIPSNTIIGIRYRIRIVASGPAVTGSDNGNNISIKTVLSMPGAVQTVGGTAKVCPKDMKTYYISNVAGASGYTWSSSSPGGVIMNQRAGAVADSVDVLFDSTLSTGYTLSVTADNVCGSSPPRTLIIYKNIPLTPSAITGLSTEVCAGSTAVSYSVAPTTGYSYSWSFTSVVDAVIHQTGTNTITIDYGSNWAGGTLSVVASNGTTCGNSVSRTLGVGAQPGIPGGIVTVGGTVKVCPGNNKTYYISKVAGASGYTWNSASPGGLISNHRSSATADSIDIAFDGNLAASYFLTVTADNNCGSSAARSLIIYRNTPVTPVAITGPSTEVCAGSNAVAYSVSYTSGYTYTWNFTSAVDASIHQSGTNNITIDFGSGWISGTLSIIASNGTTCGNSPPKTLSISSVPASPSGIVTVGGTVKVCPGDSRTYYVPKVAGVTGYIWSSISPGGTIMNHRSSLFADTVDVAFDTSLVAGFTLSVTAVNACGGSAPRSLVIYKNVPATPVAINGPSAEVCAGRQAVTYSVTNTPGYSYSWTFTSTVDALIHQSGINSVTVDFGPAWSGGTLSVITSNGSTCGNGSPRTLFIGAQPSVPANIGTIGGVGKVCPGDVKTYYISNVAGASSYKWSSLSPGGIFLNHRSGSSADSIDVSYDTALTASFIISVTADNLCGSSAPRTLIIAKNVPSVPGTITGQSTEVCANSNGLSYSVPLSSGVTYLWSFTSVVDAVIHQNGTNNITVDFGPAWSGGTLNVVASNGTTCENSFARTLYIAAQPNGPGIIKSLGGATKVCPGELKTYYISKVNGATGYTWSSSSAGGTIQNHRSGLTDDSVDVQFDAGLLVTFTLGVTADNSCGSSAKTTLIITKKTIYYRDADGDGYGASSDSAPACSSPPGYVDNKLDCNDANASINPAAAEVCNGIDDNCSGTTDEGVTLTFFRDADSDGYGDPNMTQAACTMTPGYVSNSSDCNDADAAIHPGAAEVCNSIDDNCDGRTDEGLAQIFYRDLDNDGYGNPVDSISACASSPGYVSDNTDCNDALNSVHPGATEVCNNIDDNCDNFIDEGVRLTFYYDADNDGYGTIDISIQACIQPAGYINNSTDCNDTIASIHPGAAEICNGIDDNCDNAIDEGVLLTFFFDADADGYGNSTDSIIGCSSAAGYVNNKADCNDADVSINPGVAEACNGIDDNCNNSIDEGVLLTFYADNDSDTYGSQLDSVMVCAMPQHYINNQGDCNDFNAAIHPGAVEICNGIDDNCEGTIDEDCILYAAELNSGSAIKVYPNPAKDKLSVSLYSGKSGTCKFSFIDLPGKAVMIEEKALSPGVNTIVFDVSSFAKGVYFLILSGESTSLVTRVVIE